ncbi:MAG TPA: hypothetical protein VJ951_03365, partial [Bacteroidales bacterium]|nr:hypothetical protein [Bacteroidales bacterium]
MFLQQIAKYIADNESNGLIDKCFIFPNRRSGLFFKRFLIDYLDKPSWAPEIITINELMEQLSELQVADPLDLIFKIYDIYTDVSNNPESFDLFYQWGELMIKDFDTIDKYLIDHKDIFRNIQELKEIEEEFGGLTPEQVEFIRRFWTNFEFGDDSKEKRDFLNIWKILPSIYASFRKQLLYNSIGYEGMLYRKVAGYDPVELMAKVNSEHYFFVGFNALSKAEKMLFRNMKRAGIASFFWDYDVIYEQDKSMEAGLFIRENLKDFPPPVDLNIFSGFAEKSEIKIYDLPTDILQAKTMHEILQEAEIDMDNPNHTAVVACDENMLVPILNSIPAELKDVNITMGYPFKNTPLSSFIELILRLHINAGPRKYTKGSFYHKDVLSILNHQYFQLIYNRNISTKEKHDFNTDLACHKGYKNTEEFKSSSLDLLIDRFIEDNLVYISQQDFSDSFSKLIFRPVVTVNAFCNYLEEILKAILAGLNEEFKSVNIELEREYLFLLRTRIIKLSDHFSNRDDVEIATFIKFFSKLMAGLRIPFLGEPLSGLQIMGILETRLLDFKQVIMLSVNEEVIPGNQNKNSFIPYAFRYAFGLPTISEMDAIYAYYFYRLIQRSENIKLLYNSSSEGISTGEMSRYLNQMKYQFNA